MILSIGIDGGDPFFIEKWIDKLPNFQMLKKNGVSGVCYSTIPPISAPAWVSYATGKNSGKTGIVGFIQRKEGSYETATVGSFDCGEKAFWEIASEQNKKVVIVNVPLTYPPKKVFGVLISGFPSPISFKSYPERLAKKIRKKGYLVDAEIGIDPDIDILKNELKRIIKIRLKIFLSLLEKEQPELGVVVFTETDRIQDLFYSQAKHDFSAEKACFEIYEEIDKAVGELISFNQNNITLISSDHGACSVERQFNVNDWLIKSGYLVLEKGKMSFLSKILLFFNLSVDSNAFRFFHKIRLVPWLKQILPQSLIRQIPWENYPNFENLKIDWRRTQAYAYGNQNLIYINQKGREPEGIISKREIKNITQKIIRDLKKESRLEKISIKVWKKEKIYNGIYLEKMPEIIFEMENNQICPVTSVGHQQIFSPSGKRKGDHSPNGIFYAFGNKIKKGVEVNCRIIDLAPTILYSLGLEQPRGIDGKVLQRIFSGRVEGYSCSESNFLKTRNKREAMEKQSRISKKDEEKMRRRLKGLGYL